MANEFELSYQGEANLYVVLRRSSDAKVWNTSSSAFVVWDNDDLADYAVTLTSRGGDVYQGNFPLPDPLIEAGKFRVLYYQRSGEAPEVDDLLLSTRSLYWNGQAVEDEPVAAIEVDEYALTSVEDVAAYLRLEDLTAAQTSLLAALVNQVSARMERVCSRRFKARRWIERCVMPLDGKVTLKHYPVVSVGRVLTGSSEIMRVRYTNSTALRANVSVVFDETGQQGELQLTSSAADGSATSSTLLLADYPTTSALATAIEAVEGWSATVVSLALTSQLYPTEGRDAKRRDVSLMQPGQSLEWWDSEPAVGRINFWQRVGRVLVDYRAGYEVIPADVKLVATQLTAQAYQHGRQNTAVSSETLGQYSYTLASQSRMTDELWSKLRLYMEVR